MTAPTVETGRQWLPIDVFAAMAIHVGACVEGGAPRGALGFCRESGELNLHIAIGMRLLARVLGDGVAGNAFHLVVIVDACNGQRIVVFPVASIAGLNTFGMAGPGAAYADDATLVIITMANPAIAQRIPRFL